LRLDGRRLDEGTIDIAIQGDIDEPLDVHCTIRLRMLIFGKHVQNSLTPSQSWTSCNLHQRIGRMIHQIACGLRFVFCRILSAVVAYKVFENSAATGCTQFRKNARWQFRSGIWPPARDRVGKSAIIGGFGIDKMENLVMQCPRQLPVAVIGCRHGITAIPNAVVAIAL
jgi:hypothetical protein